MSRRERPTCPEPGLQWGQARGLRTSTCSARDQHGASHGSGRRRPRLKLGGPPEHGALVQGLHGRSHSRCAGNGSRAAQRRFTKLILRKAMDMGVLATRALTCLHSQVDFLMEPRFCYKQFFLTDRNSSAAELRLQMCRYYSGRQQSRLSTLSSHEMALHTDHLRGWQNTKAFS